MTRRIRVVVVDDSLVAREMLCQILSSDPEIEVVGNARDGQAGVELVGSLKPDLVTMDIHMPKMDGLTATEKIMAFHPTPILVVSSSVHGEGIGQAFNALSAGALEVVKKPEPSDWAELDRIGREIIRKVKVLSNVKVITHVAGRRAKPHLTGTGVPQPVGDHDYTVVAIGSSTGGPSALSKVLSGLPSNLPAPVVVAQHIADGFIPGLVAWLDTMSDLSVVVAEDTQTIHPGKAYVAPTGFNVEVHGTRLRLVPPHSRQLYVPSADTLFASVARSHGQRGIGVILTGMGSDGAVGLKSMREAGAVTIAQDEKTSVVFGMPKAAIDGGAARQVLAIEDIADAVSGVLVHDKLR